MAKKVSIFIVLERPYGVVPDVSNAFIS